MSLLHFKNVRKVKIDDRRVHCNELFCRQITRIHSKQRSRPMPTVKQGGHRITRRAPNSENFGEFIKTKKHYRRMHLPQIGKCARCTRLYQCSNRQRHAIRPLGKCAASIANQNDLQIDRIIDKKGTITGRATSSRSLKILPVAVDCANRVNTKRLRERKR